MDSSGNDIERIEQLSIKMSHDMAEIRLRAGSNLLFKLQHSLIDHGIFRSSNAIISVAEGIKGGIKCVVASLDRATDTEQVANRASAMKELDGLLNLLVFLGKVFDRKVVVSENAILCMSHILDTLYTLGTRSDVICDAVLPKKLEEAIASMSSINSPSAASETDDDLIYNNMTGSKSSSADIILAAPLTLAAKESELTSMYKRSLKPSFIAESYNYKGAVMHKASAILSSPLTFKGWRLPRMVLTDSDERLLFDVEVKVRLAHDGCEKALFEALSDFPPHALLNRAGLMQAVLDIVGSTFSKEDVAANPLGLAPAQAMRWLEELMQKAVDAFIVQMEGSTCSNLPSSSEEIRRRTLDTGGGSGDDAAGNMLASQMARAMYALRYPVLNVDEASDEFSNELEEQAKVAATSAMTITPAPSLSGFAFAACAVALPLLRAKDASLNGAILSLALAALSYVREPSVDASDAPLSPLDFERIQYILERIEEVCDFFPELPSIDYDFVLFSDEETLENNLEHFNHVSCDASFIRVLIEVVSILPPHFIGAPGSSSGGMHFSLGKKSLALLRKISCTSHKMLFPYIDSVHRILKCADADSFDELAQASDMIQAVRSVYENIGSGGADKAALLRDAEVAVRFLESDCTVPNNDVVNGLPSIILAVIVFFQLSADVDKKCKSASLLLLHRMIATSSIVAKTDFVAALANLLSDDSKSQTEINLIKDLGIPVILQDELLSCLLSPTLLHSLTLYGVLNASYAEAIDDRSVMSIALCEASCQLLTIFLQYAYDNQLITQSNIDAWSNLLPPLSIINWSSSATIPTLIAVVTHHIEDLCACSTSAHSRSVFGRCLTLGLFHMFPSVRSRSALRLKHEVLGYSSTSIANEYRSGEQQEHDPYRKSDKSELADWLLTNEVNDVTADGNLVHGGSSVTVFRHVDARKLADIAFGDSDAPLRVSAVRQLRAMLADFHLLHSAEPEWCIALAKNACAALSSESSDVKMRLECAVLMKYLVISLSSVRAAVAFNALEAGDATSVEEVNVSGLLKVALAPETGAETLAAVRIVCGQTLCLLVHDFDAWTSAYGSNAFKAYPRPVSLLNKSAAGDGVCVPSFLSYDFCCPVGRYTSYADEQSGLAEHTSLASLKAALSLVECYFANHELPMPSSDVLASMLSSAVAPSSASSTLNSLSLSVAYIVAASDNHSDVRTSMDCAMCLGLALPSLNLAYSNSDVLTLIRTITAAVPRTQEEFATLAAALDFLAACAGSVKRAIDRGAAVLGGYVALACDCFEIATGALAPLFLTRPTFSKYKAPSKSKEMDMELAFAAAQLAFFNLVAAASAIVLQESPLSGKAGDALPALLTGIVGSELWSSQLRSLAAVALESLLSYHGAWDSLNSDYATDKQSTDSHTLSPPETVIRAIKLLRTPDSMIGSGALSGALKVLLACVSFPIEGNRWVEGRDWSWLSRLGYDRRAAVRVLSLDILGKVLALTLTSEGALSAQPAPHDFLKHVMLDANESGAVRTAAIKVLAHALATGAVPSAGLLGQVLSSISDCLGLSSTFSNVHTLRDAISSLTLLMTQDHLVDECVDLLRMLKVLPQVAALLSPNLLLILRGACLARVHLDAGSIRSGPVDVLLRKDDSNLSPSHELIDLIPGWSYAWERVTGSHEYQALSGLQSAAARFVLLVDANSAPLLDQFVSNTNIVQNLVVAMSIPYNGDNIAVDDAEWKVHCRSMRFGASCDLLCAIIRRDNVLRKSSADSKRVVLASSLVCASSYLPVSLLYSIGVHIEACAFYLTTNNDASNYANIESLVTSSLRLLCTIVNDPLWRGCLGLGSPGPVDSQLGASALHTFKSIITLRSNLYKYDTYVVGELGVTRTAALASRVDLSLSLYMQYSFMCRLLVMEAGPVRLEDGSTFEHDGASLVLRAIRTVVDAGDSPSLLDVSTVTSPGDVRNALKTLKQRQGGSASPTTPSADKTAPKRWSVASTKTKSSPDGKEKNSVWREKTRGYATTSAPAEVISSDYNTKSLSSPSYAADDNAAAEKTALWSALLLLHAAFPMSDKARQAATEHGAQDALSGMLKVTSAWSLASVQSSSPTRTRVGQVWTPHNGHLAAAALACSCAYSYDSDKCKNSLATAGDVHAVILSGSSSSSYGSLHHLLALGLSRSSASAARWCGLSLLGSLVTSRDCSPSAQKGALTKVLSLALQRSLHANTSDAESIVHLLDAYSACITAEAQSPGLRTREHVKSFSYADGPGVIGQLVKDLSLGDFTSMEEMSTPQLLQWIWDRHSYKPDVTAALLRCLGRMGTPVVSSGAVSKRLAANVTQENPLRIISDAAGSHSHPAVDAVATVALWSILSNSEQARATYKSMGLGAHAFAADAGYADPHSVVSRGREALTVLGV